MDIFRAVESVSRKICALITTDYELKKEMDRKINSFSSEMKLMNVCISSSSGSGGAIDETWVMELQELAYDMEDALDLMGTKTKVSLPKRALRTVGLMDPRPQHILDIREFDDRLKNLLERWNQFREGIGKATPPTTTQAPTAGGRDRVSFGCRLPPVGIQHHKEDLLDLLRHVDGQPKQLRVISIVGFRGVGKTTLAKEVYYHDHASLGEPFDCKALVRVKWSAPLAAGSSDDAAKLLRETLHQLDPGRASADINNTDIKELCENIWKFLQGKRYLIVVDDVRKDEVWAAIERAFPKERSSRIIVTTSVQSVAKKCSSGGFMYRLEGLSEDDSDKLLWQLVECERHKLPGDVQLHSVDIVRKCDGLPLALTGVAEYVRLKLADLKRGDLDCSAIVRELGNYLAGRPQHAAFQAAHTALVECYEGLYSHDLKTCLLSVSMFPKNHSIRKKSLVRRWMAEQLVPYENTKSASTVALENFDKLVDRIMIQYADDDENPAPAVGPGAVKNKCRVRGVLLDFLLDKSASNKFARLIQNREQLHTSRANNLAPRRLAIVYDANRAGGGNRDKAKLAEMVEGLDLSHVRSLTVAGTELSDFKLKCCKVLRVLDLDGCTGITDGVLRSICKIKVLRYLSLRGTTIDACGLPPEIAKLRFLETLDVRDIVVGGSKSKAEDHVATITLPGNVLCLPCLKYLFGAFELPRDIPGPARRGLALRPKAGSASSGGGAAQAQLHTLAGIFIGEGDREGHQCLQNLLGLLHEDRLKKIKIWWNKKGVKGSKAKPTTPPTDLLVQFLKNRCFTLKSLSLDFGDRSLDFVDFPPVDVHIPCKIESVKLRGKLSKLPGFITAKNTKTISDHALSKLYLSYTGLGCEALLLLQCLPNLRYLKLIEDSSNFTDGRLTLNVVDGFPSLRVLHVQAPKLPKVEIVAGSEKKAVAMQHLTTLQLLCDDISGFQAADIGCFHQLEQVVLLKSCLDKDAGKAWEAARKKHMNRPRIDTVQVKS